MHTFVSVTGYRAVSVAASVAGGVAAVRVVQEFIGILVTFLVDLRSGGGGAFTASSYLVDSIVYSVVASLSLAVGVFVVLWLITPIAAELSVGRVAVRGVLATGLGAILVLVITIPRYLWGAFAGMGGFFGNAFPDLPLDALSQAFGFGVQAGVYTFVQQVPLVVLSAVLAWMWLRKHSADTEASATPRGV